MMSPMRGDAGDTGDRLRSRVESLLARCADWSRAGRHRKVLEAIERLLPLTTERPSLEAELLIWKAQALLAMDLPQRAYAAASRSWILAPSSHACHLMAGSLLHRGETERAEELLRSGLADFPGAVHLAFQLAFLLSEQGRLPEALEVIEDIEAEDDEVEVLRLGMLTNLLTQMGRWGEAEAAVTAGLEQYPGSGLLEEARTLLLRTRLRRESIERLAGSWEQSLTPLAGRAAEVDERIPAVASALELPRVSALAARRLWRAVLAARAIRPRAAPAWACALLAAVLEIDGEPGHGPGLARVAGASPATVRAAMGRIRAYVAGLEPGFVRRSFAVFNNPRLTRASGPAAGADDARPGELIEFPGRQRSKP